MAFFCAGYNGRADNGFLRAASAQLSDYLWSREDRLAWPEAYQLLMGRNWSLRAACHGCLYQLATPNQPASHPDRPASLGTSRLLLLLLLLVLPSAPARGGWDRHGRPTDWEGGRGDDRDDRG